MWFKAKIECETREAARGGAGRPRRRAPPVAAGVRLVERARAPAGRATGRRAAEGASAHQRLHSAYNFSKLFALSQITTLRHLQLSSTFLINGPPFTNGVQAARAERRFNTKQETLHIKAFVILFGISTHTRLEERSAPGRRSGAPRPRRKTSAGTPAARPAPPRAHQATNGHPRTQYLAHITLLLNSRPTDDTNRPTEVPKYAREASVRGQLSKTDNPKYYCA
ncbi:hypothetical protein EVAR_28190_1 [Eumeta japonica]|uniref:Uncharacterized protein n=1 Tax=Eumeta variegata TaxID=151549 RepID=A0A4C1VKJ8_EUMVA|nr:hypothetical protein EVAR_28190_1 [Eumeta japonica]